MKRGRWRRPLLDGAVIAALLAALSLLPPDTSLSERHRQGELRFCVADPAGPLTAAPDGRERRLIESVAAQLGLTPRLVAVPGMGRSFNPRDWRIGRAQCDVLGGGLADTAQNRSFLTLLPYGGEIGWMLLEPEAAAGDAAAPLPQRGTELGVLIGSAGLDRLQLSAFLRARGWQGRPLRDEAALAQWLAQGQPAIASSLAPLPAGVAARPLPAEAGARTALAFGLWRGDTTLTRAFRAALQNALRAESQPAGG